MFIRQYVIYTLTDVQEMIKGIGFDLRLVEVWQSDMSPYISITIPKKSTDDYETFNFGNSQGHFFRMLYTQLDKSTTAN